MTRGDDPSSIIPACFQHPSSIGVSSIPPVPLRGMLEHHSSTPGGVRDTGGKMAVGGTAGRSRKTQPTTRRNEKQRRYRQRLKAGFRSIRFASDPVVVADFLKDAGVLVSGQDLGASLEIFFRLWEDGRVRVTRFRDRLG
jgi:hypothetical protein